MDAPSPFPTSPALFYLLLLLLLSSGYVCATNFSFDFPSFSPRSLTLLGDSYLRNGSVGLTRESGVPCSSSGTAIYNIPIRLFDPRTNISASFSTRFTFSVTNTSPGSFGDGISFFLSPLGEVIGGTGGYLGLFNSSSATDRSLVAVEFDTRMDLEFGDLNSNHVGFDVGRPRSVNSTILDSFGIDLKSENLINAWIDYHDDKKMVMIWVDYGNAKPEKPVLSQEYDLSQQLQEYMYVGFSASTEGSTEVHTLFSWSFESLGFPTVSISSPSQTSEGLSNGTWGVVGRNPENGIQRSVSLGLTIASPVLFCCILALVVLFFIKARVEQSKRCLELGTILKGPREFSYKELIIATRGFNSSRIVGSGAFGTVYRAMEPGSSIGYAVKRSKHSHQGKTEFLAEVSIIAGLRHKNLVQLQGWCVDRGELLLVYEFMPNGSLDKALYRGGEGGDTTAPSSSSLLWPQRCNVAIGIASVLAYLHRECEQQVIHRDIKTSNIMLDANFNPRLGDFGLARLMDHNKSPPSTLTAGTLGYLAPEYLQYGKATEKTDVFSYGVVLLEVCCGRRPIERASDGSENTVNLVDWVWLLYAGDRLLEAADARLNGEFDQDEMRRMLLVGLSCANPDFHQRPSMRKVVQIFNREVEPIKVPRMKPCVSFFTSSLPLRLEDIVSDGEDENDTSADLVETPHLLPM